MVRYITYIKTFKNYSYLLKLLVERDLKKKYKGSYLGVIWSLLNPLLYMIVLTVVFSTLFDRSIENYPVYLLCGQLIFGFFSSSTTSSMRSIYTGASLLRKVYIPKYIITISQILSNFIFFAISLIDLVLIMIITKSDITINILFAPIYLVLLFVFCCGVSMFLATIAVFFRDIEYIYGVFTTAMLYASAIFYPAEIIPDKYKFILDYNPIFYFIKGFRDVVYLGIAPDIQNVTTCFIIAVISMIIGIIVFEKNQDKFILYI